MKHAWLICLCAMVCTGVLASSAQAATEESRFWNHPQHKKQKCVNLRGATGTGGTGTPEANRIARYADFTVVDNDTSNGYLFPANATWKPEANTLTCTTNTGQIRLDLTEKMTVANQGTLYFHKGGEGYDPGSSPYAHIRSTDLLTQSPTFPASTTDPTNGAGPIAKSTLDASGAEPRDDGTGFGNGRKCKSDYTSGWTGYQVTAAKGPPVSWQYGPSQSGMGGSYHKYADAGMATNGDKSRSFTYLQWSWVGKYNWNNTGSTPNVVGGGYGAVRTILAPGTTVTRCDVWGVTSRAYAENSTTPVGRVTSIYVRVTRGGNEYYGWLIHSWAPLREGGNGTVDADYPTKYCVLAPTNDLGCKQQPDPPPPPPPNPDHGSALDPDEVLTADHYIISDDRRWQLKMQQDGNLVEYGPSGPVWASNTYSPGARTIMQQDGNVVIYSSGGTPIWSTGTSWCGRASLVVQNDSNLVIYRHSGGVCWARF